MNPAILRSPNLAEGGPVHVIRLYEAAPPRPFKSGGLARAAQATRDAGRGGDEILLHINPEEFEFLKSQWGEPSTNPDTGLPEYGLWSKIKKALKFEAFNVKKIVKGVLKNPQRLLTGAIDPLGTKISNKMFGSNYDPLVNQLGGATDQTFQEAKDRGMDTGLAKGLHTTAGLIAGFYGGNALGNLASTGLGNVASGLETAAANNMNALTPYVTTAGKAPDAFSTYNNMSALTPYVTTAGKETSTLANLARSGESALSGLGSKALDYAKQPKNWATIGKGITALGGLGALGGASGDTPEGVAPPERIPGEPLPELDFLRSQRDPQLDWYTYGERPEESFYASNVLPQGKARGGALSRHVRGPGSGRSDSIPARLSDGEYVFTAEDVALLGDGSNEAGAKRLDKWRTSLRKHKGNALARGKISPDAKSPMAYLGGAR